MLWMIRPYNLINCLGYSVDGCPAYLPKKLKMVVFVPDAGLTNETKRSVTDDNCNDTGISKRRDWNTCGPAALPTLAEMFFLTVPSSIPTSFATSNVSENCVATSAV